MRKASPPDATTDLLRHGGVSLGLNGTADPTDVAERAGHSVETLLRVYAKVSDGRRDANNALIEERLNEGLGKPKSGRKAPAKGGKQEKRKGKGAPKKPKGSDGDA